MTVKGQILKSASVIALVTLISRICGYLRDQRVALLLGTSPAADAFILAFRIPNLIRRMTGEGALGASFIPVFTGQLHERPWSETVSFAQRTFWNLALILGVVAVAGFVFSKQVVLIFTLFGASHLQWNLAILLNRIIFPCVFFIGLAALASAFLNSFHVFALPASTSIYFNLAMIFCSFGFIYRPILLRVPGSLRTPAIALAIGVLIGAMLQLVVQLPALVKRGMNFRPAISFTDPNVRKVGRLMGPAFFGMGVYQVNFFVDTIFATASRMPTGSITSLYIADRVMQLVLGSYAIAMSTALLPMMSQPSSRRKTRGDEAHIRVFDAHRFVHHDSGGGRTDAFAASDRCSSFSARTIHGRVHAFDRACAALLFAGTAGVCRDQADHHGVLFLAGYRDAGANRTYALGMNIALNSVFLLFFFSAIFRTEALRWRVRWRLISISRRFCLFSGNASEVWKLMGWLVPW